MTSRLFDKTGWHANYVPLILTLPGAHQTKAYKFANNMVSKAVLIPMSIIAD